MGINMLNYISFVFLVHIFMWWHSFTALLPRTYPDITQHIQVWKRIPYSSLESLYNRPTYRPPLSPFTSKSTFCKILSLHLLLFLSFIDWRARLDNKMADEPDLLYKTLGLPLGILSDIRACGLQMRSETFPPHDYLEIIK